MGKYDAVLAKLPKLLSTDPSYQEKVVAVRSMLETGQPFASTEELLKKVAELAVECPDNADGFRRHGAYLAKRYAEARRKKDLLDEMLYDVNLEIEALKQFVVDQYEVEDTTSIHLDTGEHVRVQPEPYAQVQNKEEYRLWCIKEGYETEMTLPWSKTNSIVKERLLVGEPEPPGVRAHAITKIVLRRN